MKAVQRLTGVYQAEGSLVGELRYLVGKLRGTAHCALCDITHAGVRRKRTFDDACRALPVPFDAVHLDERSEDVRTFTEGRTPCVVGHVEGGLVMVLEAGALESCAGDVPAFFERLEAALAEGGLTLG